MPHDNTIYLRTHTGRVEIAEKACGLTQSERQVLILVDGITCYGSLVDKLASLKPERVGRAIDTLFGKGLICEVLLPVEGEGAEELDAKIVERFLHQDPMDPVTIISFDPDDEFADIASLASAKPASEVPPVPILEEWMAVPPAAVSASPIVEDSDIVTDEQVAELAQQVRGRHHTRPQLPHTSAHIKATLPSGQMLSAHEGIWRRWEYWLIGTGLLLILSSTVIR